VPAPRTWWRTLVLNGQCMGAYCDVEQPDADFLAAQGLDETANLYKCEDRLVTLPDSLAYVTNYQKETNEGSGYDDLIAFIETLNETPDGDFYETFIDILDIDEYIDYYALLMLINDGDAIFKNFLLYHDLEADWWMVIPWDKDLTWGVRWPFLEGLYWTSSLLQGASAGGNILTWRLLNQPVLRNLYLSRLYESISERFPRDDLSARIDAAHELTRGSGEVDFRKWYWEDNTRLRQGAEELREFAEGRYAYIFTQLDGLFTPQELYINEFMAGNSRTITDEYGEYEDWIEIYNPGPAAVAMGDYFLTDNLNEPVRWAFPDTLLPAGAHLLVWADEDGWQGPLHANFKLSRNGELIALHKKEPGAGSPVGPEDIDPVDLVYFGPQVDDIARARFEDGNLRWAFADSASPGASNPPGQGIDDPHLPPADLTSLRLHVWPNPSAGAVHFDLPCAAGGAIEIFDVSGRLCRRLSAPSPGPAGQSRWVWNGDAFGGRPASPGAYWARYQATGREAGRATRVI
ncbi:MAG: CotH kinase family protein, partial [Gemmatimonadetes bacterium]|nr:CotH kinase family protein [Gemmatimonadota bacterium]